MRPDTLEDLVGYAMWACQEVDPAEVEALFMTDDDDPGLAVMNVRAGQHPDPEALEAFFHDGHHDCAAMATVVSWSPDESPCTAAWMLVCVQRGRIAAFLIGRIAEQEWHQIMPEVAPWFAAGTAHALRQVLDGERLGPFKRARDGDPRLFGAPGLGDPPPPEDEFGNI